MHAAQRATAAGAGEDVAAQLGRLQSDISAIKETIAGLGKAKADASGPCNCAACSAAASQLTQHAKQEAQSVLAEIETLARKNPGYVVGGTLALGVVLGTLLRRH